MSDPSAPSTPRILIAAVLAALALAAAGTGAGGLSLLETLHAAALLLAIGAVVLACGGAARMARSSAGRLAAASIFVLGLLAISPLFQRSVSAHLLHDAGAWALRSGGLSLVFLLGLWWVLRGLAARSPSLGVNAAGGPVLEPLATAERGTTALPGAGEKLESFFAGTRVRLHLVAAGAFAACAGVVLSGLPLSAALPRAVWLGALLFSIGPLLKLARFRAGVHALTGVTALALGAGVLSGALRYLELRALMADSGALFQADERVQAEASLKRARDLNEVLRVKRQDMEMASQWALFYERKGELEKSLDQRKRDFEESLHHWRQVAAVRGVDPAELLQVRRVLCKMGDSLNTWRRLIHQGFPAVSDPEIAAGIYNLAEQPGSGLRPRLLAALLAWEAGAPEPERRRRLEEVLRVAPYDPTSRALLRRMGDALPDVALWIPPELIVGKKLSKQSELGAIEELGEVDTVAVLDKGQWELALSARATPLHEEWPIVRIELNGQRIGRTQIARIENHESPFTFEVQRGNLFHIKIVFENRLEELDEGRRTRRGLAINGIALRRANGGF